MDLVALFISNDSKGFNKLLVSDTWQEAIFYHLSTDSVFWNTASLTTLSKACAPTAPVALLYLLQKEAKTLSLWDQQWDAIAPTTAEFINSVITSGRFTNTKGKVVPIETFWKKFSATMEGVTAEPTFRFSMNELPARYHELLNQEDVRAVICFDDSWQEQNYLIETSKEWMLYNWLTAA